MIKSEDYPRPSCYSVTADGVGRPGVSKGADTWKKLRGMDDE